METKKDWTELRKRRMLSTSASQFETFDLCQRKWWLSKVRKLEEPTTGSQVFGTVLHAVIERFLLADDLGRGADGLTAVCLYPEGWEVAKNRYGNSCPKCKGTKAQFPAVQYEDLNPAELPPCNACFGTGVECEGRIDALQQDAIKRLVTAAIENGVLERLPGRRVEQGFNRQVIKTPCLNCDGTGQVLIDNAKSENNTEKCPECGGDGLGCTVMITGYIDVLFHDMIQDHKSTKSMKWAKSPAKLAEFSQMLIYARECLLQAEERGEPIPQSITLRHNQYCHGENKVRVTQTTVTREQIEQHWTEIVRASERMAELRQTADKWSDIQDPTDLNACNAYGGCPFRGICYGQETEETYEKRMAYHKSLRYTDCVETPSPSVTVPTQGVASMPSLMERLAARTVVNNKAEGASNLQSLELNPPTLTIKAEVATPTSTPAAPVAPVQELTHAGPNAEGIAPPPWASKDCNVPTCRGLVGFGSTGKPCQICSIKTQKAGGKPATAYTVENNGDGTVTWFETANPENAGVSYITGKPAAEVKASVKEAAPADPLTAKIAGLEKQVEEAKAALEAPMPAILGPGESVKIGDTTIRVPAIMPTGTRITVLSPASDLGLAPKSDPIPSEVQAPAAAPKRTRRTKEQMIADEAKAAGEKFLAKTEGQTEDAAPAGISGTGLVLVIGAVCTGKNCDTIDLCEVFDEYGKRMAQAQTPPKDSYFDLDPFRRRDEFYKAGAKIAEELGDCYVVCPAYSPDFKALVDALRPHAAMVIQGVS